MLHYVLVNIAPIIKLLVPTYIQNITVFCTQQGKLREPSVTHFTLNSGGIACSVANILMEKLNVSFPRCGNRTHNRSLL